MNSGGSRNLGAQGKDFAGGLTDVDTPETLKSQKTLNLISANYSYNAHSIQDLKIPVNILMRDLPKN